MKPIVDSKYFHKLFLEPVFYFGIKNLQQTSSHLQTAQIDNHFEYSLKKNLRI